MKEAITKFLRGFLFLLIISCNNNSHNLKTTLSSTECYWDLHNIQSSTQRRIAYCYKFNKDGSCELLFTKDKTGKRDEFDFDDNQPTSKTWQIIDDSTILILGIERKVISFSKDTVLLVNPMIKENDTLIKNCK